MKRNKDLVMPAICDKCYRHFDLVIKSKYANTAIEKVFQEMFGGEGIFCEECYKDVVFNRERDNE
jgi:hypothetical protein